MCPPVAPAKMRISPLEAGVFCLCLILYLALRVPWIGHGVGWDEALNLCTTRAFFAGGTDAYSEWFWRHPPLFNLALLFLEPLRYGFIERAQTLVLGIWALAVVVLYVLNRRAFGPLTALLAIAALAVMPGARFFDVWIKQEPLLVLFGLLALLAQTARRPVFAGLFLGLAFLCKEFVLFFAMAIFVLWLAEERKTRRWRDLFTVVFVALAIAGWWYLCFSSSIREFFAFATGAPVSDLAEARSFTEPWDYFFRALPLDLGWPGILLLVAGLGCFGKMAWSCRRKPDAKPLPVTWWPLALLLTAWLILSIARGKAAWFLMSLYPALATVQAVGAAGVVTWLSSKPAKTACILLVAGLLAGATLGGGGEYDVFLARRLPRRFQHATTGSREAAMLLNELWRPGDNVLITTYYFYPDSNFLCPILLSYLRPMPIFVRRHDIMPKQMMTEARTDNIQWALVAPDPARNGVEFVREMAQRWGRRPMICVGGILLYHTASADRP